jgi:hypothetical protein
MFQFLQVKTTSQKFAPDPGAVSIQQLLGDASIPISIQALIGLPESARRRLYNVLIPPAALARFNVNPISWKNRQGELCVRVHEIPSPGLLNISAYATAADEHPFFCIEIADNTTNGIDLNLLQIADTTTTYFATDKTIDGKHTEMGILHRNLEAEAQAKAAGLSPGQTHAGLRSSGAVFAHLEAFLALLAHQSIFLEPLTYTSAWIFEQRGFAYIRGHKMMDTIHAEFQPGGKLHNALDDDSPFRSNDAGNSVRGRAWAIHDGILNAIDLRWNDLRMIKQIGRNARVNTFPGAVF